MLERPLNAGTPRRGRGKTFRIGLDVGLCAKLERAAAARGLEPEVLLKFHRSSRRP